MPAQPGCSAAARLPPPAKPPSGRHSKPQALAGAASGASLVSIRGSLDGALGPAGSAHDSQDYGDSIASSGGAALKRLSSVGSDASGDAARYTSRSRLGRAVCVAEGQPVDEATSGNANTDCNGPDVDHSRMRGHAAHLTAGSAQARRANRRLPSSAPHSPRRPRSSWDGGPSLQGGLPRRRQHSWDGGASPLGASGGALLGLAHVYAPGLWTAASSAGLPRLITFAAPAAAAAAAGASAAAGGAAAAAAEQQVEEPQFFDPSAHAMRLRVERSGALSEADPTPERHGEPPAWHCPPKRAASSASGAARFTPYTLYWHSRHPYVLAQLSRWLSWCPGQLETRRACGRHDHSADGPYPVADAAVLPYPAVAAAAEAARAAEAAHLARERRWRLQRRQLELSHARKRDAVKVRTCVWRPR